MRGRQGGARRARAGARLSLSAALEARAARKRVHVIWYVFEAEDDAGEDVTWGMPLSIYAFAGFARLDAAARSGTPSAGDAPPGGRYLRDGPVNLLALRQCGFITDAELGAALRSTPVRIARPRRWYHPSRYEAVLKSTPLTAAEAKAAAAIQVWTVYYEDRFHMGDARECYPVAVCLSAAEAGEELQRRGRPVESGTDGYSIQGPGALAAESGRPPEIGADAVREVLLRITAGKPGPVPVR